MNVVTRFAPSPTGYFHAGSYRTALFSWIYARQNNGKFILRIEDTDRERSKREYEDSIIDSLKWLGLSHDQFYRQSERTEIYKKYLEQLMRSGHAYLSREKAEREGNSQVSKEVIRFRNPNKRVVFQDLIRGQIEFDTTELADFIIAKDQNTPLFHLAVVIDDLDMGISHVIRGDDHISNTPRQILIYEALGAKPPAYAHIPLLLATDRSKLSKRKGAIAISEYRDRGFLPEAIINYLALLGWHPQDDREIISLKDIIKEFSLERVQKGGAIFDEEKLKWFNHKYISQLNDSDFIFQAGPHLPEWISPKSPLLGKIIPILKEKIVAFSEINSLLSKSGELGFIHQLSDYSKESLLWAKNRDISTTRKHLEQVKNILEKIPSQEFNPEKIKESIWPYAETEGRGNVLWPLRMALTGREKSPDPFLCTYLLEREESLRRIKQAIVKLGN